MNPIVGVCLDPRPLGTPADTALVRFASSLSDATQNLRDSLPRPRPGRQTPPGLFALPLPSRARRH